MTDQEIPEARGLRWPILVALDQMTEEDSVLDLQDRVARHLNLTAETAQIVDPETDRPLLTERLVQAIADLHEAGVVQADDGGRFWLTEAGRRMTENEVDALPDSREDRPDRSATPKPTARHYLAAILDAIPNDWP